MISTFVNAAAATFAVKGFSNNWTTLRTTGANLGVGNFWGDTPNVGVGASFDTSNYILARYWFSFNMDSPATGSVIPTDAIINAVKITLAGSNTQFNDNNNDSAIIVPNTITSNTVVATSDWGNIGTTQYAAIDFGSWNQASDNVFTLNASGIAALVKNGGYSKYAMRSLIDSMAGTPNAQNVVTFTGTGVLTVDYEPVSTQYLKGRRRQRIDLSGVSAG